MLEEFTFPELKQLQQDGFVEWSKKEMVVTTLGLNFIRNICKAFDLHLLRNQEKDRQLFSKAI
jgi:oxygen-independent coproporphyrinogen-3 oxidase